MRRNKVHKPKPTQAIGYIRVSTEDQRLSPKAQAQAIEQYAQQHSLTLLALFLDLGISGATPINDRPSLPQALALCHSHQAHLIVAKRDRLARDSLIAIQVERSLPKHTEVLSADGSGNGQSPNDAFMRGIMASVSQLERALIKERTIKALAVLASQGKRTGAIPFGYCLGENNVLAPDPSEQGIIRQALALRAQGLSLRTIAKRLGEQGATSRKGTPLGLTQIARILSAHGELDQAAE